MAFLGCEKSDSPSQGYPTTYYLYFELLNIDGSARENGDVELTGNTSIATLTQLIDGQYPFKNMGKIEDDTTQSFNGALFGGPCGASGCGSSFKALLFATGHDGIEANEPVSFEKDKFWLLRYENEDVDTLRVHDIQTVNPYKRTFTFFINEQQLEATEFLNDKYAITIQK
jgi:hypothetical protein